MKKHDKHQIVPNMTPELTFAYKVVDGNVQFSRIVAWSAVEKVCEANGVDWYTYTRPILGDMRISVFGDEPDVFNMYKGAIFDRDTEMWNSLTACGVGKDSLIEYLKTVATKQEST